MNRSMWMAIASLFVLAACNTFQGLGKDAKAGESIETRRSESSERMQPFRIHQGLVAPIDRENVDTDAIIPSSS
jgi:predicted small secreted protein